jgi:hypothetical protein
MELSANYDLYTAVNFSVEWPFPDWRDRGSRIRTPVLAATLRPLPSMGILFSTPDK